MTTRPETLIEMAEACDTLTKLMLIIPGIDTTIWAKTLRDVDAELVELREAIKVAQEDMTVLSMDYANADAECQALKAKLKQIESQEPVGTVVDPTYVAMDKQLPYGTKLYVLPPVNAGLVEAAQNAIGCFNMACSEGLDQALAETADERLKDLVERRLLHAPGPLADALLQSSQPESRTRADGMPDSKTLAWSFRLSKPTLARSSQMTHISKDEAFEIYASTKMPQDASPDDIVYLLFNAVIERYLAKLELVYELGWRKAADWALRDDLLADIDSPIYQRERDAALQSSQPEQGEREESDAELLLRELASYLGVGGYNAPSVDVKVFREKIYDGIRVYSIAHGVAARELAEQVLGMDMATDRGLRARDLARKVLGAMQSSQPEPARNVTKGEHSILQGALLRSGKVIHPPEKPEPARFEEQPDGSVIPVDPSEMAEPATLSRAQAAKSQRWRGYEEQPHEINAQFVPQQVITTIPDGLSVCGAASRKPSALKRGIMDFLAAIGLMSIAAIVGLYFAGFFHWLGKKYPDGWLTPLWQFFWN